MWYYDAYSGRCQAFVYTGCGGNANRFISEEQCERQCGLYRGRGKELEQHNEDWTNFCFEDVCSDPRDPGSCQEHLVKFYYDRGYGRCLEFAYTGCGGNGNRFSTVQECESVCVRQAEALPTGNDTSESSGKF